MPLRTGRRKKLRMVITIEKMTIPPPIMTHVLEFIHAFVSGVMSVVPLSPLMRRNHIMHVTAKPAKMPIFSDDDTLPPISPPASVVTPLTRYVNENTRRAIHCTTVPKKNATATLRNIAMMTLRAFSVFSMSPRESRVPSAAAAPEAIFSMAMANAPPRSSKTMLTVVDVGMPRVLKMSSRITSVTMTARKTHMTSWKEKYSGVMMP